MPVVAHSGALGAAAGWCSPGRSPTYPPLPHKPGISFKLVSPLTCELAKLCQQLFRSFAPLNLSSELLFAQHGEFCI